MNFKNAHALWSAVFMRTLRNCGVRLLAFAPDAALSPLADAAAETPRLDAVPAPDARAAGFFALGSAKSAAKPTALLCAAGTSDADCLAAVAEARFSRAPLLVIRAERAAELVPAAAETERGGPFSSFFAPEKILVPAAGLAALEEARDAAVCAVRACAENGAPVFVRVRFRDARFFSAAEKNFPPADVPAGFDADAFCRVQQTLDEMGVKPIEAVGKPFDPDFHNAVMHIEDESLGENVVAAELQKGYTYRESVVRHSMVQVAN